MWFFLSWVGALFSNSSTKLSLANARKLVVGMHFYLIGEIPNEHKIIRLSMGMNLTKVRPGSRSIMQAWTCFWVYDELAMDL